MVNPAKLVKLDAISFPELPIFLLSAAHQTGGNDQPEGGRDVNDDLPISVPQGQTEARSPRPTQAQPQQGTRLRPRTRAQG